MNNLPFEFGLNFMRLLSLLEPDGGDDAPETIKLDPSEYSVASEDALVKLTDDSSLSCESDAIAEFTEVTDQ